MAITLKLIYHLYVYFIEEVILLMVYRNYFYNYFVVNFVQFFIIIKINFSTFLSHFFRQKLPNSTIL